MSARSQLGWLDRVLLAIAPGTLRKRELARLQFLALRSAYDATNRSRLRKETRDYGSGNNVTERSVADLRNYARHLERNHDLARGVLNTLVQNTVGAQGILIEPQPRGPDGQVDEGLAQQLADLWDDWCKLPEVTGEFDWPRAQRMLARSWFRDGEVFYQHLRGNVPYLSHGTLVPYSIEMLEADFVPLEYSDEQLGIVQGIECNAWKRPVAFHVFRNHPGDPRSFTSFRDNTKRVLAADVEHIKLVDRIQQLRGVSAFASVLTRLEDLKDYEESERIAAKVAASLTAYIKRGAPEDYDAATYDDKGNRAMVMTPGLIADNLRPGEDIGVIDSNRPNPNAATWRSEQLRAVSAGMWLSYSSAARNYNGTYSAQRQELVESWGAYALLSQEFIDQCPRQVYESFVALAVTSGRIERPRGWSMKQLMSALYVAPAMPWIDPVKEANAGQILEDAVLVSGPELIRRAGRNPRDVVQSEAAWRRRLAAEGLRPAAPSTSPSPPAPPARAPETEEEEQNDA